MGSIKFDGLLSFSSCNSSRYLRNREAIHSGEKWQCKRKLYMIQKSVALVSKAILKENKRIVTLPVLHYQKNIEQIIQYR